LQIIPYKNILFGQKKAVRLRRSALIFWFFQRKKKQKALQNEQKLCALLFLFSNKKQSGIKMNKIKKKQTKKKQTKKKQTKRVRLTNDN